MTPCGLADRGSRLGKEVYANNNEIACKQGDGKVVAAFPDVCLSPPPPPTGPVPVPYPDSSFSRDIQRGSKRVTIGGGCVALRDASYYKSSPLGNEAATRNFGGSVISHTITGKTYFVAWSMDVKFEGKNVPRHIDLTTSNHASPGSTPPNPNLAAMKIAAEEAATGKCQCCHGDVHSAGTAMTFDEWYGLNEKDSAGRPTQQALGRRAMVEKIKNKAQHGCTCNGRVLPEPPCNVFRKPVTKAEHKEIVKAHDKNARQFRKSVGVPPYEEWKAAFPQWKQADLEKQVKVNHLVPKNAGGCPVGYGNLQAHGQLCRLCKSFDDMFGEWQSKVPTI